MSGDGLGLDQGFEVGRHAAAGGGAHGRHDLAFQLVQGGGPGRGALDSQGLGGAAQGGQLVGVGSQEEAVEAAGDAEPPRGRIVDLLHVRKQFAGGVAHPLGGAPANAQALGHLVEGQALGGTGEEAGEAQEAGRLFMPHGWPTSPWMIVGSCDRF